MLVNFVISKYTSWHECQATSGNMLESLYYQTLPLLEVVTISLAYAMDPSILDHVSEILGELNLSSADPDEETGMLIFTLLPGAEPFERSALMRKFARLRRFMKAA